MDDHGMDDRRSERFGRYEILSELGRGAMGVVYKARDPKINRLVAIKTVSLAGQPPEEELEYRERFFREAEAAGRLSHPGIVTIFDVGEEPETRVPYIVMEFVGGQSLDKLLSRKDHKLPLETALQLTIELAKALDCAHDQGVVHRDLKPANILLTEDGHAKIADFGVAKLNLASHTHAERALGTPAYMSPEQLNGEAVDGRSDLFSLGVVLYTVLTGYRPFQGNSALTISFKVVNHEPIPATVLDTELPPGLDHIIARAMAKDPAERYQRGMEMVHDIQKLREGLEPLANTKAKLPGLPAGGSAGQTLAAKPRSSAHVLPPGHGAAGKLLQQIGERSVAGVLVLAGLFILGLWAISFGTQGGHSRAAEPLPLAGKVAPVAAIPTASAAAVSSIAKTPPPVVEKLPKPVPAGRTHPPSTKTARASSPPVSRAALPVTAPATLAIAVEHSFAEAHLSIWVDDRLTYTHQLEGTDKKHLVVFHHVQSHEVHAMQVSPGKHSLKVQVTSGGATTYDRSATVAGEFVSGQENVLRIKFSKHGEINLTLQ